MTHTSHVMTHTNITILKIDIWKNNCWYAQIWEIPDGYMTHTSHVMTHTNITILKIDIWKNNWWYAQIWEIPDGYMTHTNIITLKLEKYPMVMGKTHWLFTSHVTKCCSLIGPFP